MKMNQDMDKIKVLLVEDEQTLAMIIKDTLEGQNFIIHTAADGEEGLRMFFDLRPDVLVADVMMPRMDGFEMVRHIRQTDKRTPVLFLTARSSINDVVEGFELGANDYLKKPFGMQELIVRIKALVGKAFTFREEPKKEETCFEIGDYNKGLISELVDGEQKFLFSSSEEPPCIIDWLESLRQAYLKTKDRRYWKELVRWLPESWLQTRTVTLNYENVRNMYFQRRHHKLTEWSEQFVAWVESLPYAKELIMYEGDTNE